MPVMVPLASVRIPALAFSPEVVRLEGAGRIPAPVLRPGAGTALYCALRRNQARH